MLVREREGKKTADTPNPLESFHLNEYKFANKYRNRLARFVLFSLYACIATFATGVGLAIIYPDTTVGLKSIAGGAIGGTLRFFVRSIALPAYAQADENVRQAGCKYILSHKARKGIKTIVSIHASINVPHALVMHGMRVRNGRS
jgi:hypothetical protein